MDRNPVTKVPTAGDETAPGGSSGRRSARGRGPRVAVSEIDIVLLGLVSEQPRNAYEINKVIRDRHLRSWLRISEASVYRNLRVLASDGHLTTHTVRSGASPEKTVFTMTGSGVRHLRALVRRSAGEPVSLHFDFDVWLAHLDHLDASDALDCIEALRGELDSAARELSRLVDHHGHELPPGVRSLLELRRRVVAVTRDWLGDFPIESLDERRVTA